MVNKRANSNVLEDQLAGDGIQAERLSNDAGKLTYWTPDGRKRLAYPRMVTWEKHDAAGKIIEQGVRDANLDEWLSARPNRLKPYCPHCDKWHDTKAQIEECGQRRAKLMKRYERIGKKERQRVNAEDDDRIAKLEDKVDKLTTLLEKALKVAK